MYGGDEPSTPSPPARSQVQPQQQQQQREVYVGDDLPPRSNSTRKKSKEPAPSATLPTIVTTKTTSHSPPATDHSRSFSVTGDDIEAAFDAINDYKTSTNEPSVTKAKDYEIAAPDSLFGLSTIKEAVDTDEVVLDADSSRPLNDEEIDEIDFDNCFNKYKHQNRTKAVDEKTPKRSAPSTPVHQPSQKTSEPKSTQHSYEPKRLASAHTDEIRTPVTSVPTPRLDTTPTPTVTVSSARAADTTESNFDDPNDSGDEDVDELLGKLEVSISLSSPHAHIHTHTYTHDYILVTWPSSPLLLLLAENFVILTAS